ncbi:unnamed protein product [Malus baccata var. baccata]
MAVISSAKTELRKYLDEERLERKQQLDILSWWKMEQYHHPVFSRLACDEFLFLLVIDQYRSYLLPETVHSAPFKWYYAPGIGFLAKEL